MRLQRGPARGRRHCSGSGGRLRAAEGISEGMTGGRRHACRQAKRLLQLLLRGRGLLRLRGVRRLPGAVGKQLRRLRVGRQGMRRRRRCPPACGRGNQRRLRAMPRRLQAQGQRAVLQRLGVELGRWAGRGGGERRPGLRHGRQGAARRLAGRLMLLQGRVLAGKDDAVALLALGDPHRPLAT